ncbi:4-coumarate--CoA ligase 4 [Aplysia californica]|uniref:4-coumarate--CoA ligase 4 n=1 Tax=Aplysia californica TaxID=6500 RepID=A0ABM1A2L5_APLCA|nr:4-coumarate--CoA ligase 4 [Aplysia californica]
MIEELDTVLKRLQYFAEHIPDKEFFIFYGSEPGQRSAFTARQVYTLSGRFAARLHQQGFQRHDVIANTLPNSPERVITDLGVMMCGCTPMNGQVLLADGEDFFQSARVSRCQGIIVCPCDSQSGWRLVKRFTSLGAGGENTTSGDGLDFLSLSCEGVGAPELKTAISITEENSGSKKSFLSGLMTSTDEPYTGQVEPDDVLMVFTTSGSTGYSKLVPRTHKEAISLHIDCYGEFDEEEIKKPKAARYSDARLGWAGGYPYVTYILSTTRVMKNYLVPQDETKHAHAIWTAICNEQCPSASIQQVDIDNVLKFAETSTDLDGSKLKMLISSGRPLNKRQVRKMHKLSGRVMVGYAATECGLIAMGCAFEDTEDFYCGKPAKGIRIRIVDSEGNDLKTGETGTVWVKGGPYNIVQGYFNKLEDPDPKTLKAFTGDGWFNTNDSGYLDEDGNMYVIGRGQDTISHGSFIVYPGWMEKKIEEHIEAVEEACVVPVSDPVLYHKICACVRTAKGSDFSETKLREFCETLFVESTSNSITPMPEYFMIMTEFPRSLNGKINKRELRRQAEEKFCPSMNVIED